MDDDDAPARPVSKRAEARKASSAKPTSERPKAGSWPAAHDQPRFQDIEKVRKQATVSYYCNGTSPHGITEKQRCDWRGEYLLPDSGPTL